MQRPLLIHFLLVFLLVPQLSASPEQNRITFHGREIFLNGLNLAWSSFANDIGPNPATPDLAHFEHVFQRMNASGANVMRLWLHTTGAFTPAWDGDKVIGPGKDTIEDLRAILDLAWQYDCSLMLCLWSFDMLRISNGSGVTDRSMAILTMEENRQTYIENSLRPMVAALKGHPAILCWEIFNEPEGMSEEHGWGFNRHVPMAAIQAFVNLCAGAIRREDPGVMVSNGSWAFIAASDVGSGNFNYYTDERLIEAGGDPDGTLDFYMVHYYDWAGTSRSPFHHPASHWNLDKPLVVAEFYPNCENCGPESHLSLFENGYAGALSWSWTDVAPDSMLEQIDKVSDKHPEAILLRPEGRPAVSLLDPQPRSWFRQGIPVKLSASASSPSGSISMVVFVLDGKEAGQAGAPGPFDLLLNDLSVGSHTVHATAVDDQGRRARSNSVDFTVGRPELLGRREAENADFSGVSPREDALASGGVCLEMKSSGYIEWTVDDVPTAGSYELIIGYNLIYDSPKTNTLSINGASSPVIFNTAVGEWAERSVPILLKVGTNTIRILPGWGWMLFDYIALPSLAQAALPEPGLRFLPFSDGATFLITGPPGIEYHLMASEDLSTWRSVAAINPDVTPAPLSLPAGFFSPFNAFFRLEHVLQP